MKFTQINSGHVVGLREVLELLSSAPPQISAKQLMDKVVTEALLGQYGRTESGRHRTNKRLWIYETLMMAPNLSEELIRKGIDRIFEDRFQEYSEKHTVEWTARLWFVPYLPLDLKEKFLKLNHQYFSASQKIKKVLDNFLPLWLAASIGENALFRKEGQIPLFMSSERWELLDQSEKGVLLHCSHYYSGNGSTNVVLLPDVSGKDKGCAEEVSNRVRTVHEAIAWLFSQDPKKWQGFDEET